MHGTAWGAERPEFSTVAVLRVNVRDEQRDVLVGVEPRMADDVAEAILAAETWAELPTVEFESWQVLGEVTA